MSIDRTPAHLRDMLGFVQEYRAEKAMEALKKMAAASARVLRDNHRAEIPLAERVSLFVDRAWEHFRSRHFRCAFAILLDYLGREEHPHGAQWREQMTRAWDRVWSTLFADARIPRGRNLMLQHYTVATLSGLATMAMMEGASASLSRRELQLLKDTLTGEMTDPA